MILDVFMDRKPFRTEETPIGTVIAYDGLTAPKDYLICDGGVYNISDYPDLANHFNDQFGSKNYHGGNGVTTFAVPDMRNLFLRGYHRDSEEQLSGEIGVKQEATLLPYYWHGDTNMLGLAGHERNVTIENVDSSTSPKGCSVYQSAESKSQSTYPDQFTVRPVNTAVLYCIKAVKSSSSVVTEQPIHDIYSTEETRIGTWINGKTLYRRVVSSTIPTQKSAWVTIFNRIESAFVVRIQGYIWDSTRQYVEPIPTTAGSGSSLSPTKIIYNNSTETLDGIPSGLCGYCSNYYNGCPVDVILEYTKTTD